MKRLILMRHAKSDWSMGEPDKARPLNKRGEKSAKAIGAWLQSERFVPDEALVSSAARTRQTWDLLDLGVTVQFEDALYLAEPDEMLEVLKAARKDTVLMIGHNPGICDLAHRLVDDPPAAHRFEDYPTGATLVVDFDVEDWADIMLRTGQVEAFKIPRELV